MRAPLTWGHSTSISTCRVWGKSRARVQVSIKKFHTHIYLDYARIEFLSCIQKKKKIIIIKDIIRHLSVLFLFVRFFLFFIINNGLIFNFINCNYDEMIFETKTTHFGKMRLSISGEWFSKKKKKKSISGE